MGKNTNIKGVGEVIETVFCIILQEMFAQAKSAFLDNIAVTSFTIQYPRLARIRYTLKQIFPGATGLRNKINPFPLTPSGTNDEEAGS